MPSSSSDRRRATRRKTAAQVVRMQLIDHVGQSKWVTGDVVDISEGGIGVSVLAPLAVGIQAVIRGRLGDSHAEEAHFATVKWCVEAPGGAFHAGLEFGHYDVPRQADALSSTVPDDFDRYEVMQLSPNADEDTIQRVYRALALRYHPDSTHTGNPEMFLRLCQAYKILSNPESRAQYDVRHRETKQLHWQIFDQAQGSLGAEGEQRKRQGILELLYRKTIHSPDRATMTVFDFEQLLGCPREHLEAALWYLRGKDYVRRGDNGQFLITVLGFDNVESHLVPQVQTNQHLLPSGAR